MRALFLLCPAMIMLTAACDTGREPTAPSGPQSFLTGTWRGTVTIQVESDLPGTPSPSSASTTWTFEVAPQTNLQTFRATIHSGQHAAGADQHAGRLQLTAGLPGHVRQLWDSRCNGDRRGLQRR
jgi:hypothetical protein